MNGIEWDFNTTATAVIFFLTYLGVAIGHVWGLKLDRTAITLLGAIAMLAFGCSNLQKAIQSVNMQSILMLFGLMVIAGQLHHAGFYGKVAERISRYLDRPALFLLILMIASGVLSAFLNNDVICFAFTPVVTVALVKKKLNPIPFLVALALSSNLGCALTMIGNAQNVLIGQIAHLDFGSYMAWVAIPALLSMGLAYAIVWGMCRHHLSMEGETQAVLPEEKPIPFNTWRTIKGVVTICVIVGLFFSPLPRYLVTLTGAGILLCSHNLESRKVLYLVDWQLLILFIGLFVVVGAFHDNGLAEAGVHWLTSHGVDLKNKYVLALTTGFLSNLINNSAAVMLLVKVVDLNDKTNGYVLALSNTFAGNLFLIGSVANIIVAQGAAVFGVKLSFIQFAKYGVPVAVGSFAILLGWIYLVTSLL